MVYPGTNFTDGLFSRGIPIIGSQCDPSGKVYFVDANKSPAGDGSSWDEAFNTIAVGLAAADAQIGLSVNRAWARRNTVFYCGDYIEEALVLAAEKTDLIGVGSDVGSMPRIVGNFTIGTAVVSFRIINMGFMPTSTDPVITFPAGMHGWETHHVICYKSGTYLNSAGILSTSCADFRMVDTRILADSAGAVNTLGLSIAGATAAHNNALIDGCQIFGVEGIDVAATSGHIVGAVCKNSYIKSTNLIIDDNSDSWSFINNFLISAANSGNAAGLTIVDWNAALACGNTVLSGDHYGPLPILSTHA